MAKMLIDEEAVFDVARQIPSAEARHNYLIQICGDDTALLARVKATLRELGDEPLILRHRLLELRLAVVPSGETAV